MGMHDGHRKHLRENFLATGLSGKTEHQALELLLTYAIPRIDVNPVAHELIMRFGSLAGVIDADVKDLVQVDHISENSAVLLKLIPQIAQMYSQSKWKEKPELKNTHDIIAYMRPFLFHERNEVFYLLALNNHCRLIEAIRVSEGTPTESTVHVRNVVNECLRTDATQVVLMHNHPSGSIVPSPEDIQITHLIVTALNSMGVKVIDHIILGGEQSFSMFANGILSRNE